MLQKCGYLCSFGDKKAKEENMFGKTQGDLGNAETLQTSRQDKYLTKHIYAQSPTVKIGDESLISLDAN